MKQFLAFAFVLTTLTVNAQTKWRYKAPKVPAPTSSTSVTIPTNAITSAVSSYLYNLPGYAGGNVLTVAQNGLEWTKPTSATTTVIVTGGTSATVGIANADSTINRVDESILTDVNLPTVADLTAFLGSNQTNKRGVMAMTTYDIGGGMLEQTGTWTNVKLYAPAGATITTTGLTAMMFQTTHTNKRIKFENITFVASGSGGGNGVVFSNELHEFHGLEFYHCRFMGNELSNNNAFGFSLASTASLQGATSSDFFFRQNFLRAGRMGTEILNQVYDGVIRLKNVVYTGNTISNTMANPNEPYRMATSFSGLVQSIYHARNSSFNAKDIAFEFVNIQDAVSEDNMALATLENCVAYSITDDSHHVTKRINIRRGNFNVTARPFQVYGSSDVHFDGGVYVAGRGADVTGSECSFNNMQILVHDKFAVSASWQFSAPAHHNSISNCVLSAWGSVAAGTFPNFETIVLRTGTFDNAISNTTLQQAKKSDGSTFTDGKVVNQGSTTNTVDNFTNTHVAIEQ